VVAVVTAESGTSGAHAVGNRALSATAPSY
jgi:hypothetical protein